MICTPKAKHFWGAYHSAGGFLLGTEKDTAQCAVSFISLLQSVADVGQKRYMAGTLDRDGQLTLMLCTSAGNSSGKNLRALADELAKSRNVLVIDLIDAICAELADLLLSAHTGTVRLGSVSFGSLSIHFENSFRLL